MSESLGSTNSWNGGSRETFLRSASSTSGRSLLVPICDLFLSEKRESDPNACFPDDSRYPFLHFLVVGSSLSNVERRLFNPDPCVSPSLWWSLEKDLGSLKPILGLLSLSGWFSLGFLEESLGTFEDSQTESLKALLGSFKSLKGLSLWSLEGLWSLEKLLLLVLVVVAVVRRSLRLPLKQSCR